jgi:mannose-6-phosphate isomerase-like protein (cupin superfamily)
MADYTVKRIDEMDAAYRGAMKRARAELGVTAFGLQVIDLPPGLSGFEHDHAKDGQEEVYVALRGSGEIEVEGKRVPLDSETMVRVGPEAKRTVIAGAEGLRVLAIGGTPGRPYEWPAVTELGAPDPMAR